MFFFPGNSETYCSRSNDSPRHSKTKKLQFQNFQVIPASFGPAQHHAHGQHGPQAAGVPSLPLEISWPMPSMLLAQLPLFPGMALLPFEFGLARCHVTDDHFDFAIVCRYLYIYIYFCFLTTRRYADFRHSVYFLLGCTHVILLSGTLNCTQRGQTWIVGTGLS